MTYYVLIPKEIIHVFCWGKLSSSNLFYFRALFGYEGTTNTLKLVGKGGKLANYYTLLLVLTYTV